MKSSQLKKGDRVLLSYGEQNGDLAQCRLFARAVLLDFKGSSYKPWQAVLEEKLKKDGTVFATVEGFETEMGSVYNHDILGVMVDGTWEPVEHNQSDLDLQEKVQALS